MYFFNNQAAKMGCFETAFNTSQYTSKVTVTADASVTDSCLSDEQRGVRFGLERNNAINASDKPQIMHNICSVVHKVVVPLTLVLFMSYIRLKINILILRSGHAQSIILH